MIGREADREGEAEEATIDRCDNERQWRPESLWECESAEELETRDKVGYGDEGSLGSGNVPRRWSVRIQHER